jgi:hypothetical protein
MLLHYLMPVDGGNFQVDISTGGQRAGSGDRVRGSARGPFRYSHRSKRSGHDAALFKGCISSPSNVLIGLVQIPRKGIPRGPVKALFGSDLATGARVYPA